MKKTTVKIISISLAILVLAIALTACGASKNFQEIVTYDPVKAEDAYYPDGGFAAGNGADAAIEEYTQQGYSEKNTPITDKVENREGALANEENRKLIRDGSAQVQTKEFDKFVTELEKTVAALGGYLENSDIQNNSYSDFSNRYAEFTVRVPAEKFDEFFEKVGSLASLTNKTSSIRDITADYIDVESRIKALEAEQKSLLSILERATKISDIIEVQSRLTDVNAQLDAFNSKLRSFDNLVAYSTIILSVQEVERVREEITKPTFFQEIKRGLSDSFYDIGQGIKNLAINFISNLPYIIIWAIIGVVVIVIIRKIIKKRKAKKQSNISS